MILPKFLSWTLLMLVAAHRVSSFQQPPYRFKTPSSTRSSLTPPLYAKKKKGSSSTATAIKVQVRLKHHIAGTGQAGDIIQVTPAFFNNKLRPQGLAEKISDEQKEAIEEAQEQEQAQTIAAAEHLQETLGPESDFVLKFTDNKTGPDGKKLFGGVNAKKLMNALQREVQDDFWKTHKTVRIMEVIDEDSGDKVKSSDIKQTGEYLMKVQLTKELFVKIKVVVA